MQTSWWKDRKDLDEYQQALIMLPADGGHLFVGPPGCGKTNMLVLRARYLSGGGDSNVLFLTYGRTLSEFIKTGVISKKHLDADQVMTFSLWAYRTLRELAPDALDARPDFGALYANDHERYKAEREWFAEALRKATENLPRNYFDAIFVDEVQDFTASELEVLSRLTERLNVAGDSRQKIYGGNGLDAARGMQLRESKLDYHYRIGPAICTVADKVLTDEDTKPLIQTCRYNDKRLPSSALAVPCETFAGQLEAMAANIRTQLKAFQDETIGIFLPTFKHGLLDDLMAFLAGTDFAELVGYHSEAEREFDAEKRIFVMTCHSSKGTEFRAVHILAAERFRFPLGSRTLVFTAVTRAKTSLRLYYTGQLSAYIKSAFAERTVVDFDSIF